MKKKLLKLRNKWRQRKKQSDHSNHSNHSNLSESDECILKTPRNGEDSLENKISKLTEKHTKRHLIVDDIDTNRETLSYFLGKKGITTYQASNGAEAVEVFSRHDLDYFDVIWMDIKMPFMDGIGATTIIRDRGYENIIVMITGHINRETLLKCKLQGADKIYPKPITREKLYEMDVFQYLNPPNE